MSVDNMEIRTLAVRVLDSEDRYAATLARLVLNMLNERALPPAIELTYPLTPVVHGRTPEAAGLPVNVVMTEPPGPTSQFVEVEDDEGRGLSVGEWRQRPDGMWSLRLIAQY
jgi:hypothetical protein